MWARRRGAIVLVLALLEVTAAHAQTRIERAEDPSEADIEAARGLYEQGLAYIDELQWEDALHAFQEAYARSGVAAALYNVATALRALGRHVEARDAIVQLFSDHAELDPGLRTGAERLLREEEARIGTLVLEELPREPPPSVRLDGRLFADTGERPLSLDVDPGSHALFVIAPGMRAFEWQGTVEAGERRSLRIQLTPLPSGGDLPIVLGIAAAFVAASIAAAVIGWAVWDADEIAPMGAQVIRL